LAWQMLDQRKEAFLHPSLHFHKSQYVSCNYDTQIELSAVHPWEGREQQNRCWLQDQWEEEIKYLANRNVGVLRDHSTRNNKGTFLNNDTIQKVAPMPRKASSSTVHACSTTLWPAPSPPFST
jgi:hypothetical protein